VSGEQRIGWRRHLRPTVLAGGGVALEDERGVVVLRGTHVAPVSEWLDGSRSRSELISGPHGLEPGVVAELLDRIDTAGLLAHHEAPAPPDPPRAARLALFDAARWDALTAEARLEAATVLVLAPDGLDAEPLAEAIRQAGVGHVEPVVGPLPHDPAHLAVVLCRDYRSDAVARLATALRAAGVPWLPVRPGSREVWQGPVIEHGTGPCWDCLRTRVLANRPLVAEHGGPGPDPARPVLGLAVHGAALLAAVRIAGGRADEPARITTSDVLGGEVVGHPVVRRPECPTCGDPDLVADRAHRPVSLRSRPADGPGLRPEPAWRTRERLAPLVDPLTGVVRSVRRDERGPTTLRSFRSGANPAAAPADGTAGLAGLRSALRGLTGGKGTTDLDAELGAICESVERSSGAFHGDEATVRGSLRSLGPDAIHPDRCRLQDPRQLAGRDVWNREHSPFQRVLDPFDPDEEMDWTPVWSLSARRHRLLPTGMLYYGAPGPTSVAADSNGCAAGATVEDAVLQGMLELVERDAVAIWWYDRSRVPGIELDATDDPWIAEVLAAHASLGREVWALDVSADLGVPVVVALSRRTDGDREDIALGFGAHPDPGAALRRALCELNQMMPAFVEPGPLLEQAATDPDLSTWLRTATVENQPYLRPLPSGARRAPRPRGGGWDLLTEIDALRARIESAGSEVLVLDQTRPDVGLPVVRVIAPGLRHWWSRLAPGRLYQVPVTLGRRRRPLAFEDLNPVPMFL
jgi:oxazoline/thiazoline synthase